MGESGSGKSVSSFSILKLIEPPGVVESDGILFQGEDISKKSEREMMKIRGKAISMVFQDPMTSLNPLYTIEKQITEMLDLHQKQMTKREKHARCVELLHMVGIPNPEDRLKSYPHQFSGGMRQRVIIASSSDPGGAGSQPFTICLPAAGSARCKIIRKNAGKEPQSS